MQNIAEKMEASFADDPCTESQGSLLTFADMALALDIFTADHTYALHDEQNQPIVLERVVKLKDHNYSFTSKHDRENSEPDHEDKSRCDHGYSSLPLDQKSHKRSLSEENLSKRRLLSSNPVYIRNANVFGNKDTQEHLHGLGIGTSSENVTLCNSWPKPNYFEGIECKIQDHTYARDEFNFKAISRHHRYPLSSNSVESSEICNCKRSLDQPHDSDCDLFKREKSIRFDHAYSDKPTIENHNLSESKSSVGCDHPYFDKPKSANRSLSKSNASVKIDHAYFDKPASANESGVPLPEVQGEITVKSDHSYSDQVPVEMLESCYLYDKNVSTCSVTPESVNRNEKQLPMFGKLRNKMTIATDHAYQGSNMSSIEQRKDFPRSIAPTCIKLDTNIDLSKPKKFRDPMCKPRHDHNYYNGSVESLDINFSSSDTDSCDETAAEVTRLAFSAWCQLRKDHPYSTI